jgi:electron transfer flavoprotein alpha subunit
VAGSSDLTDGAVQGLPENYAPLLVENIKKGGFTHVVAGHTAFGKNLMPRVAALLDTQQISDITEIESEDSKFGSIGLD